MTRNTRVLLLLLGLGVVALLVWHVGLRIVARMLVRVGWSFPVVVGIYAVHVAVRAVALWRTVLDGAVRYTGVLRIWLSGEAMEGLTFTGPFLAEPAKGWLLRRRGMTTAAAFAAVITEYLLYTVVSSCLAILALSLLLSQHMLAGELRPIAILVITVMMAFLAAFAFASVTGTGLIVPILRGSRVLIGRQRAERAADEFGHVERLIIGFLHGHPTRLVEVIAVETAAHALLVLETWVVIGALGFSRSWINSIIVEGGVKFVAIAFAFVPGQFGASEGIYALLATVVGLTAAAGLSLAFVRRLRGLFVAAVGIVALTLFPDQSPASLQHVRRPDSDR